MSTKENLILDRIEAIKNLKTKSENQQILLSLFEKNIRTANEEKQLKAIVNYEMALVRTAQAKSKAKSIISQQKKYEKIAERKNRNHRLIQQGVLFDLAQLTNRTRGELLGALLSLSNLQNETERWASYQKKGDEFLEKIGEK